MSQSGEEVHGSGALLPDLWRVNVVFFGIVDVCTKLDFFSYIPIDPYVESLLLIFICRLNT